MRNPSDFRPENHGGLDGAITAYIEHPDTILELKTASDLGYPAVVGIARGLLAVFGEQLDDDDIRKLVGRRIRPVLEREGYRLEKTDVEVRVYPFSKGARYSLGPQLYVFRSTRAPVEVCITSDRDGSKLPAEEHGGRWRLWSTINDGLQAAIGFGIRDLEAEIEAVQRDGFTRRKLQRILRRG